MPAKSPEISIAVAKKLMELSQQIRARRKGLGVTATTAAMAAGMSRVTLHRLESGEPSVTIGAYLNAIVALGLDFSLAAPGAAVSGTSEQDKPGWIPVRIHLADYPQLKQLAWHVHGTDEVTPKEALAIYERNWRHIDVKAMDPRESNLVDALRLALGKDSSDV